jgi:hypothetical protein
MIGERTGVFGRLGYRRSYIVATRCQSPASMAASAHAPWLALAVIDATEMSILADPTSNTLGCPTP